MIEITQQDFEGKIEEILLGKTTRKKLIKELKIDRVTLNNKIQELIVHNPELYHRFIAKFPYMPREYTHINWRAMLIDIMKKGYTKFEAADQYEINDRTIARKVYKVQEYDPDIVELYRKVSRYRKMQKPLPKELQEMIDSLPEEEVFIGEIYDKREEELIRLEKEYTKRILNGQGATEASKECGTTRVSKSLNTLYRIKIEEQHGKNIITGNNTLTKSGDEKEEER